jgi:hypothetical protein
MWCGDYVVWRLCVSEFVFFKYGTYFYTLETIVRSAAVEIF